MTPADIKEIRKRLGLTQAGLAAALGMGRHGERTVRDWEALALTYLGQGALDHVMKLVAPEYVFGADFPSAGDEPAREHLIRLWRPRFVAIVGPRIPDPDSLLHERARIVVGEWLQVVMWVDDPAGFDVAAILSGAAAQIDRYTEESEGAAGA